MSWVICYLILMFLTENSINTFGKGVHTHYKNSLKITTQKLPDYHTENPNHDHLLLTLMTRWIPEHCSNDI